VAEYREFLEDVARMERGVIRAASNPSYKQKGRGLSRALCRFDLRMGLEAHAAI
jgi:hypothetical protein